MSALEESAREISDHGSCFVIHEEDAADAAVIIYRLVFVLNSVISAIGTVLVIREFLRLSKRANILRPLVPGEIDNGQ